MNVAVKLNEGLVIYPSYDPQHSAELIKFYQERFHTYQIAAYKITNNAGVVVATEGEF